MANWQNIEASEELVQMIQREAGAAFKEATGQAMPEGFANWSFRKMRGEYIFGIEMEAAQKALGTKGGGNIPVADAEAQKAILAWVEYIRAGHGTVTDAPAQIREAVVRGLKPVEAPSLMPPAAKAPLMPPSVPAKGSGMVSNAALIAAARRKTRKGA